MFVSWLNMTHIDLVLYVNRELQFLQFLYVTVCYKENKQMKNRTVFCD